MGILSNEYSFALGGNSLRLKGNSFRDFLWYG